MNHQEGEIKIYAACLAAYNNGILYGRWINAEQGAEDIKNAIGDMLKASPIEDAEEYAIHDYEGFEGVSLSEYTDIDHIAELAEFIGEHGLLGGELINLFGDLEEAQEALEDRYYGQYNSVEDFAEELTEQTTEIPEALRFYIDYEKMARDLEINDITAIETGHGEVHVFWSH